MGYLFCVICSILGLAVSISHQNISIERNNTEVLPDNHSLGINGTKYFFLSDLSGNVIILDANTNEKIISYKLPEIEHGIAAIVDDTFYNIDTLNGTIWSTSLQSIKSGPSDINWANVGSFPSESSWIRNSAAVNGTLIYFVTHMGNFYLFNAISKTTTKLGTLRPYDTYASLLIVDKAVYIHKFNIFYKFDGNNLNIITTPNEKHDSGLFQLRNYVCRAGGNITDVYPDPVTCYDPVSNTWSDENYINEARWCVGIAATESNTWIFGGLVVYAEGNTSILWRYSIEVLNHETNTWRTVPTPLVEGQYYIQATYFTFNNKSH